MTVQICRDHDAACGEVPVSIRCANCPMQRKPAQPEPGSSHPAVAETLSRVGRYSIKEAARIDACDSYFKARPQIDTLDRRKVFESGFDRGYDAIAPTTAKGAES